MIHSRKIEMPGQGIREILAQAFDRSQDCEAWSDSPLIVDYFQQVIGIPAFSFQKCLQGQTPSHNCIVIPTDPHGRPIPKITTNPDFYERHFGKSACLMIPFRSFAQPHNNSSEAEIYLLESLNKINLIDASTNVRQIIHALSSNSNYLKINSQLGTKLEIELGDNLQIVHPKTSPSIKPGEWVSIAQYLEVGIIPLAQKNSFRVDGELHANGFAIAHHIIKANLALPEALTAWNKLSNRKNGYIVSIENNQCTSIKTSIGEEIKEEILVHTDASSRGKLLELAFSTINMTDTPNWGINSQINEAWGGIHIAFGAGVTGAHIDFIDTVAETSWQQTER